MRLLDFVFPCAEPFLSNGERATGFLILLPMAESFVEYHWHTNLCLHQGFVKENSASSLAASPVAAVLSQG